MATQEYSKRVGFSFDNDPRNQEIENWRLSAKEFYSDYTKLGRRNNPLSPSARQIEFTKPFTVVDDIYDNFYDYSLPKQMEKDYLLILLLLSVIIQTILEYM